MVFCCFEADIALSHRDDSASMAGSDEVARSVLLYNAVLSPLLRDLQRICKKTKRRVVGVIMIHVVLGSVGPSVVGMVGSFVSLAPLLEEEDLSPD